MSPITTCKVLGVPLAVTDYAGAVAQTRDWAGDASAPRLIAAANTHVTALARHDPQYRAAIAKFDLILPDGMPLVWTMNRSLETKLRDRVYGPTFMLHCLEATQGDPWRHLFVGGTDDLLAELSRKLLARFPRLKIAGTFSPPFGHWTDADDNLVLSMIEKSDAQFIWIGLGCPKQELWLAKVRERLRPAVYSAVGAAFAFHAGRVRQAPLWIQKCGMEWLFRLCAEPRRLWRRYVVFNSLFIGYLLKDAVRPPAD